jgi:DHA1 family bicyclomycin/chloramphenicol resistance-like MFS transporter
MTTNVQRAGTLTRPEFIGLMAGLMALNALAIDIMLPALPYMGEALGVSHENERQYVIGVYMLGFGLAQLAFGPLTDRFGRRGPLLFGLGIYVVCAFAATFAPNFVVLLALRFVQGLGAASTRVIATAVVRDRFSGREMAEIMSLTFMVFMVVPIIAPGIGQVLLLTGPWETIFIFNGALAAAITFWAYMRLPETLNPDHRRALRLGAVAEGFRLVVGNRMAFFYGLAGMFLFGAMFGFITASQQIFVEIYELGALFPLAFAAMAGTVAVGQFINSRVVRRFGMRRLAHTAILVYVGMSSIWLIASVAGPVPLPLFYGLLLVIQFVFGWAASNMNSLSMEPLGAVAGTAASVFGFMQTVGGATLGTIIGQQFNGTLVPTAAGYTLMGLLVLTCVLIAERGKLFGIGAAYESRRPAAH